MDKLVTIERHILNQEREHPEATGTFSNLLYDIALAAKIIARETMRAGLTQILGMAGRVNIQGEQQMKLDVFANETLVRMNAETGRVAVMASEETDGIITIPEPYCRTGRYALLFDPLDGSSNIDVNVSVGTIFAILPAQKRIRARDAGGLPAARPRPGRGRLRDLRPQQHAGVHGRPRRARLHAGSQPGRISAVASEPALPRYAQVLQREPGQRAFLERGRAPIHRLAPGREPGRALRPAGRALRGFAGGRFPSQRVGGRHLLLPVRHEEPRREAAAGV